MTLKAFIAGAIYCGASALTLANAQISAVENQPTGTMETALEGSGIDVTGLTVQRGNTRQYGTFSNGLGTIGIEAGVFISTGRGINFGDPATSMSDMANLGNTPDLDLTAGRATATNDTASLVMTVTPMGDTIAARIVFASEEYPEYVCSAYNDAFGLYVTEPGVPTQNIAVIPGTTQDVSINTINNGFNNNGQSCPGEGPNNSNLYNNNPNGPNFIFNGYTDALNVQLDGVTPGQNYTFKMVVADAIDTAYDSAVFVDFLESTWANTADASFQLTPSTVSPIVGQNFTITATLSNAGPDPIPFLKVKDLLPDGLTFVSASGDGTYDETLDEWETTAPLAAEADFTVTLTVSAPSVATFATDAEVIEQWSDDVDSTPNDGTGDDFASLSVTAVQLDRSDAPDTGTSYGEATHDITAGIQLGAAVDADAASIANADASGDGADDDGVTFPALRQGQSATISVDVTQASAGQGYLQGWIDWNGDGDFADPGEQVASDLQFTGGTSGTINVPVTVPADAVLAPTFARFRWSTISGLDASTAAPDGEVEDYQVAIVVPPTDIELDLTLQPTSNPIVGVPFSVVIDVSNASFEPATGVSAFIPTPAGLSLVEIYDAQLNAETGDFEPTVPANYNDGAGVLTVGNVPAQSNVYYIARYVRPTPGTSVIQAEISAMDQPDVDSSVASGFADGEDDTDSVTITATQTVPPGVCQTFDVMTGGTNASVNALGEYIVTPDAGGQFGYLWSNEKIDLSQDFDIELSVYLGTKDANGADGMTFVIQNDPRGLNAFGASGGGLGAGQPGAITPSLVVEFDTWNNGVSLGDTTALDHTAVYLDGDMGATGANRLLSAQVVGGGGNIEDGQYHSTRYVWNADTQTFEYFFDGVSMGVFSIDLVSHLGNNFATIGFTGSTGGSSNLQKGCFTRPPVLYNVVVNDFSDAPTSGTAPNGSGAVAYGETMHTVTPDLRLGALVDEDAESIANADASGDGADDDGVTFPTLTQGQSATISVEINQASANQGYLQGWIDWNGDGDFDDPAEQVATDLQSPDDGASTISVPVTVPAIATTSPTFARFRWSTTSGLDATTAAGDGEVEDYQVTIDVADGGSTVLPPVCSTGARATLDWTASSWPQSSLSNTYAVSDTDISVQVLDPQGALNGTPNGPTPVNAGFYQGGLASIDNTLIFEADDADLANGDVTIRYEFSRSVEEVRVNLFDLDFSDLGPRIERATITAYNGATPVPVTLQGGSAILVSGNSAFGIAESDPIGAGSGDGTLRIGVSAPIDRLEISYGHGAGTDRDSNPGNPGFGLHHLSFCAQIDRSDAPAGYGAADHALTSGFLLGSRNDSDAASLASADAAGDGADDDGVTLPVLTQGLAADIQVDVTGPGLLQAWIDFDGDGAFGAGEQIAADVQDGGTGDSDSASNGIITLSVTAPVNGFDGTSIARFRWSSDAGLGPTGLAGDGEVEDYQVEIVEIAALAFTPDNTRTVSPGSSVIYAHNLLIPETLAGGNLDFTQVSDQDLIWTIWQDVDGSGDLSSADTVWVNGNPVPGTGSIGFLLKSEVPNDAHEGWRDLSTVTATVTLGGQTRSDSVTDITDVNALDAGSLRAYKLMALDLNCDGDLSDESAADAAFEVRKQAQPGQCVIYRIGFVNDGIADVSAVNVRDHVPAWTVYEAGSATYETTPTGLTAGTLSAPAGGTRGPISFPYTGSLPAGEEGTVTYGVRVGE